LVEATGEDLARGSRSVAVDWRWPRIRRRQFGGGQWGLAADFTPATVAFMFGDGRASDAASASAAATGADYCNDWPYNYMAYGYGDSCYWLAGA